METRPRKPCQEDGQELAGRAPRKRRGVDAPGPSPSPGMCLLQGDMRDGKECRNQKEFPSLQRFCAYLTSVSPSS